MYVSDEEKAWNQVWKARKRKRGTEEVKLWKRGVGMLLAVLLAMAWLVPQPEKIAMAAPNDIAGGSYGSVTWVIDADGKLTVSGSGDFRAPLTNAAAPWFSYAEYIRSADIQATGITDMSSMFAGCYNLVSVSISDTGSAVDMSWMFNDCERLVSLDASRFNTGNVTDMSYMFANCFSLAQLNVSGWNTRSVTNMSYMFSNCYGLTSLDLSGFDAANAADMSYLLDGCANLKTVYSPIHITTSASLPESSGSNSLIWVDASGNEWKEMPRNLDSGIELKRILALPTAVKYVPFEAYVGGQGSALASGTLPEGLALASDGKVSGVPCAAGAFDFSIWWTDENGVDETVVYRLVVGENTNPNVDTMSDPNYELIEYVPDLYLESLSGTGSHTLVSRGDYSEFVAVYLNGRKLTEGTDYTSAPGSTRITIRDQTLTDEGEGTHTIGIEFRTADNTLRRAVQNYTVLPGKAPEEDNSNTNNSGGGNSGSYTQPPVEPVEAETETVISHVVQRGDTLWKLAIRYYGAGRFWTRIYQDNREIIRSPHRLSVGQVLTIYLEEGNDGNAETEDVMAGDTYTVKAGDSLWRIARKYYGKGSLWQLIYEANQSRISSPGRIRTGQVFTIPSR